MVVDIDGSGLIAASVLQGLPLSQRRLSSALLPLFTALTTEGTCRIPVRSSLRLYMDRRRVSNALTDSGSLR